MPFYIYEHEGEACMLGESFSIEQKMSDEPITECPHCGGEVFRVMTPVNIGSPDSDTDLRDKGFAKLVKRDTGVYENVTALDGESRYFHADKPETAPDLLKRNID